MFAALGFAAPVAYAPEFATDINFEAMDRAILWEQRVDAPRAESYYAETTIPYTYGQGRGERTYFPHMEWSPLLAHLKARVEEALGERFELLFCNRYADARQHLGWHADDSVSVDPNRPIPVLSFGAEREIQFRENGKGDTVESLKLKSGSLLVMKAGMQQTHQHRIPKVGHLCGPRISLTFRGLTPG